MPAFYPRSTPSHHPLTPPDSGSGYGYSNMHYPQDPYASQQAMTQLPRHENAYDYQPQGYLHPSLVAPAPPTTSYPPPYQQQPAFQPVPATLPSISSYYEPVGATILPPIRIQDRLPYGDASQQRLPQHDHTRDQSHRQAKEEKATTGGVSAKLDYDMDRMTDFVVSATQHMYDLHLSPICLADIDLPRSFQHNVTSPPSFRKWVHQVLSATRLPSATLLLSLHYLSDRLRRFPDTVPTGENHIYRLLAVALILGSKFLDDNTFINRSWSDVTAIKVSELNSLELKWLRLIDYHLHVDKSCIQPWLELWTKSDLEQSQKQLQMQQQQHPAARLSPLDTTVPRHHTVAGLRDRYSPYPNTYASTTPSSRCYETPLSSNSRSSQYSSTPYTSADPWAPTDRSASFEDFYKRGGSSMRYPTLADIDDANRRASEERLRSGHASYAAPYTTYQQAPSAGPYTGATTSASSSCWDHYAWNGMHHGDCNCSSCAYRAWRPYNVAGGYGMGTVMG